MTNLISLSLPNTKEDEMEKRKVITDNSSEILTIIWDGVKFGLVCRDKTSVTLKANVIILSPVEMMELVKFAGSLGGD